MCRFPCNGLWYCCSIQLCVAVQLPEALGGVQDEAVFIDTEGSFVVERVADVAKATVEHCRYMASADKKLSNDGSLTGLLYSRAQFFCTKYAYK